MGERNENEVERTQVDYPEHVSKQIDRLKITYNKYESQRNNNLDISKPPSFQFNGPYIQLLDPFFSETFVARKHMTYDFCS